MVKKLQKISDDKDKKSGAQLAASARDSAQQIWLAGLGAFSKAQEEGNKLFETLVKEGLNMQRKTQSVAEEKISDATSRLATVTSSISERAAGQWDKLESIFEDRVAQALNKLGVPSARDVEALIARIDELTQSVEALTGVSAAADRAPAKARRAAAKPAVAVTAAADDEALAEAEAEAAPVVAAEKKPASRRAPRKTASADSRASADAAT